MKDKQKRLPKLPEALCGLMSLIVLIVVGNLVLGLSTELMFVIATFIVIGIGLRCNYPFSEIKDSMMRSVADNAEVLCIMLGIGAVIGSWIFSGTVPVMIAWLASIISVKYILVLSFVFCAIIAAIIGTSSATLGTIGIIMLSVAQIQGINSGIAAAAVISGSLYGQITSVIADMVNWNAGLTGNTPQSLVKLSLPAQLTATVITIVIYLAVGFRADNAASQESLAQINILIENVYENYNASPIVLIPVAVLFLCIWRKIDTTLTLYISVFAALTVGVLYQGFSVDDAFSVVYGGFNTGMFPNNGTEFMPEFASLVTRGGMTSMTDILISIPLMMMYCGALAGTDCAKVAAGSIFKNIKKPGNAIAANTVSSFCLCAATGSMMAPGILGVEMFSDIYESCGLSKRNMAVSFQFCCTVGAYLFPWTAVCAWMESVVAVPSTKFIPFLFMSYIPIIIYIIFGYLGIGIAKLDKEEMQSAN